MNEEKKARELVDKFRKYSNGVYLPNDKFVYKPEIETKNAKQCALIAVETVIDFMIADDLKNKDAHWSNSPEMREQQRIKSIISKL